MFCLLYCLGSRVTNHYSLSLMHKFTKMNVWWTWIVSCVMIMSCMIKWGGTRLGSEWYFISMLQKKYWTAVFSLFGFKRLVPNIFFSSLALKLFLFELTSWCPACPQEAYCCFARWSPCCRATPSRFGCTIIKTCILWREGSQAYFDWWKGCCLSSLLQING